MPRRRQRGKGIVSDVKKAARWVYDNRAGIKKAHDYVKENKLISRAARAVGSKHADAIEQRGYGGRVAPPVRMKFAR